MATMLNTSFEAGLPTQAQLSLATANRSTTSADRQRQSRAFRLVTLRRGFSSHQANTDVDFNACTTPLV
jgi:hypothetical protein